MSKKNDKVVPSPSRTEKAVKSTITAAAVKSQALMLVGTLRETLERLAEVLEQEPDVNP